MGFMYNYSRSKGEINKKECNYWNIIKNDQPSQVLGEKWFMKVVRMPDRDEWVWYKIIRI